MLGPALDPIEITDVIVSSTLYSFKLQQPDALQQSEIIQQPDTVP